MPISLTSQRPPTSGARLVNREAANARPLAGIVSAAHHGGSSVALLVSRVRGEVRRTGRPGPAARRGGHSVAASILAERVVRAKA
jgi:hypothetical protein